MDNFIAIEHRRRDKHRAHNGLHALVTVDFPDARRERGHYDAALRAQEYNRETTRPGRRPIYRPKVFRNDGIGLAHADELNHDFHAWKDPGLADEC